MVRVSQGSGAVGVYMASFWLLAFIMTKGRATKADTKVSNLFKERSSTS
jgi:hypothetical protein